MEVDRLNPECKIKQLPEIYAQLLVACKRVNLMEMS